MAYETLNLGINLTLPTSGTRNWAAILKNTTWTKISQHQHTGGGDGNQLITASYSALSITGAKIAANTITYDKLALNVGYGVAATVTPVGTTQTLDFNLGIVQKLDLSSATGDVTLTLSNPIEGARYQIWITQGATPRDIIWPAAVKWPQGQKPILSITNGYIDYVELNYISSVYRGLWELNFS